MQKGKLIIFEGMDCCGKSTQLELAYQELIAKGFKVIKTREPGGTEIGEKIRELLKSKISFNKTTEAYLFATARCEHNLQIKKWIEEGYIVLCDRHIISSYVYQDFEIAKEVNKVAMDILEDIDFNILYFDMNHNEYIYRINKRNEVTDRFEDKLADYFFFNNIRKQYKNILNKLYKDKTTSIYTHAVSIKKVYEKVIENIEKIIIKEEI